MLISNWVGSMQLRFVISAVLSVLRRKGNKFEDFPQKVSDCSSHQFSIKNYKHPTLTH